MASTRGVSHLVYPSEQTKSDFIANFIVSRRFPVISGFSVEWDSRRAPGQRVLGIWLQVIPDDSDTGSVHSDDSTVSLPHFDLEKIEREKEGKKYKIVTREYMAAGHDGFHALTGQTYLIDDETGQLMSSLVRKYLLGEPC